MKSMRMGLQNFTEEWKVRILPYNFLLLFINNKNQSYRNQWGLKNICITIDVLKFLFVLHLLRPVTAPFLYKNHVSTISATYLSRLNAVWSSDACCWISKQVAVTHINLLARNPFWLSLWVNRRDTCFC